MSGRALARSAGVSPTTANSALAQLQKAGFVTSLKTSKATNWYLETRDPTIRNWINESHDPLATEGLVRPLLSVVILTALKEEYAAVVEHLNEHQSHRAGTTRFEVGKYIGDWCDWTVYVGEIGPGNSRAAAEITNVANLIKPQLVMFVGVAGSVKPHDVGRGDLVIADRVYNIHSGKDIINDGVSEHLSRPLSYLATHGVIQLARSVRQRDWTSDFESVYPGQAILNIKGVSPRVEIRSIAAGEVVHGDVRSALMEKVRTNLNDVAAVDMESAGVYEAAHVHVLPALAIRGISDCIGDKQAASDAEWQPRAAKYAATFAYALLRFADEQDFSGPTIQEPELPGESESDTSSARELLFRLPPAVSTAYFSAVKHFGPDADDILRQLESCGSQPATWLSRFRHRPSAIFKQENSGPLWLIVAVFAESHEHATSVWLYEQAAERAGDSVEGSYLLLRAAISAYKRSDLAGANRLLESVQLAEPDGEPLWEYFRSAFDQDLEAVLMSLRSLAEIFNLGFSQPVLESLGKSDGKSSDSKFQAFLLEFGMVHPSLFEQLRREVALETGNALASAKKLQAAQVLLEGLSDGLPIFKGLEDSPAIASAEYGTRSSSVLLNLSKVLLSRAATPTSREPGFNAGAALARAAELALTARDRRLDWFGPTGDALSIAAQARASSGDTKGALSLLLLPPEGTANPQEASSESVVCLASELAVGCGNVELALELAKKIKDPVERRIAVGLGLTLRPDTHPEAASELRAALDDPLILTRIDQEMRALLTLSMVDALNEVELSRLEKFDSEIANIIRAQTFLTAGRTNEAQVLARQYPDNDVAVQIRVEGLLSQGKVSDAIAILEKHGKKHGEDHLLIRAAIVALTSGMADEASRLALLTSTSVEPSQRRMSGEILLDVASANANWEQVLIETNRLLNDVTFANSDPEREKSVIKYRWAQVHALYQLQRTEDAYRVLREQPRLEVQDNKQARLVASIVHSIAPLVTEENENARAELATQAEILTILVELSRSFPEDEELQAATIIASLSMPVDDAPDPALLTKARQLQEHFFAKFPQSQLIRMLPMDEEMAGITEFLRSNLAPTAKSQENLRRQALSGQIPMSVFTSSLRRSYAEGLIRGAVGCYVIQGTDVQVSVEEVEVARRSLNESVVVDTSALYLSRKVFEKSNEVLSRFENLIMTSSQRDDVLSARASLRVRSTGSLSWDPVSDRPTMRRFDGETTERWATESAELANAAEYCKIVPDPLFDGVLIEGMWSSPIRLAKEQGLALFADDAALRSIAKAEGVPAFGSLQLLTALIDNGDLPHTTIQDAYERLMTIRAAELPLHDHLLNLARKEAWSPASYSGFLFTRPHTWSPPQSGLEKYMELIRELPDRNPDLVAGWMSNAMFGLCMVTPPPLLRTAVGTLVGWTALAINLPDALPTLIEQSSRVVGQFTSDVDVLESTVNHLVLSVRQISKPEDVAKIVLGLLSGLSGEAHEKAVKQFLQSP